SDGGAAARAGGAGAPGGGGFAPPGAVFQSAGAPPVMTPEAPARRRRPLWWLAVCGAAALAGLGVLGGLLYLVLWHKDTDGKMAAVAGKYEDAVGVVILAGQRNGQAFSTPMATAWAVGAREFVSNGHVAKPVAEALSNGWGAFIVLNKHPERKFRVTEARVHPRFNQRLVSIEGKEPAVPAYDIGLLRVDEPVPNRFRVAPDWKLRKVDSGCRVAYLGFPMENMVGEGVDARNPVANMQSGIITSTTDWWLAKAPFEKSLLLAHNLAATGGASGSPIFNADGEVVGVLSAGNMTLQLNVETGQLTRTPSAVLINYAQRIDLLRDIYPDYPR
ncbi:MAG TPA: serine protease, partial [Verrucomicrobiota bacterium]|nr:serine protease [Verrucomicrobiota bacterium]